MMGKAAANYGITHDYETQEKLASDLTDSDVLVGESGGLSSVHLTYATWSNFPYGKSWHVATEHGTLVADPHDVFDVLDLP